MIDVFLFVKVYPIEELKTSYSLLSNFKNELKIVEKLKSKLMFGYLAFLVDGKDKIPLNSLDEENK